MAQTHQQKQRERLKREQHRGYGEGDTSGHEATAYSSLSIRFLEKSVGTCRACRGKHNLINGYCGVCRTLGANEWQCMKRSKRKGSA